MNYSTESGDEIGLRLCVSGRLTFNDHLEMKNITRHIITAQIKHFTFDFSNLDFIDSAGIGMLLIIASEVKSIGGLFIVENPCGHVARVFEAAKIRDMITILSETNVAEESIRYP